MKSGLEGKVAMVVGAGQGIGRAAALALAEGGSDVACLDREGDRANSVAAEVEALGVRALAVIGDVSSRSSINQCVADVVTDLGKLDVAVDIVGEGRFKSYLEHTDEDWDAIFDICLRQFFFVSQACLSQMVAQGHGGSFVGLSSASAYVGVPQLSIYAASKAALSSLVRSAAVEMGPFGIRVNAVAPGSTRTPRTTFLDEEPQYSYQAARLPAGRRADPEEQANTIAFLLSDRSSFITGQTILVDGGAGVQAGQPNDGSDPISTVATIPSGSKTNFRQ